ncbi:unnamed protein product [Effrenium voratum]|nr:unnamed protein product [Effrenium voratum]
MAWNRFQWQADSPSASSAVRAASECRREPQRRVWMGAALAAARKFIEVPKIGPERQEAAAVDQQGHEASSSRRSWCEPSWQDWRWSWGTSGSWDDSQWRNHWELKSDWTDWRGRESWGEWRDVKPQEAQRTFEVADPFVDLSLASLAQEHDPQSLEEAMHSLARQLKGPEVRLSRLQLLRCFQALRLRCVPELAAAVARRAQAQAAELTPEELVEAARSVATVSASAPAAECLGVLLGESICRHGSFDLDQLAALAIRARCARGAALKALLLHVEVEGLPENADAEDQEVLIACLDRLADQVPRPPEDLAAALAAMALLGARDDPAAARLTEELSCRLATLGTSELALLSWALGTMGLRSVPTMEALAEEAVGRIWRFSAKDVIKLLFGFAALGLRHGPLLEAVARSVPWSTHSLRGLVQLSWCFATLASPQQQAMKTIAQQVLPQLQELSSIELASVAWSFASLRLRHGGLMHAIALEAAARMSKFEEEDLARLAWAFANLDLAPRELTRLLVAEAEKRDAAGAWRGHASPDKQQWPTEEGPERGRGSSPSVDNARVEQRPRQPSRRRRKRVAQAPKAESPAPEASELDQPPEEAPEAADGPEAQSEVSEADDKEPEFDALLHMLREQIRAGVQPREGQEVPAVDIDGSRSELTEEDKARILELLEARRVAESAAGRKRSKSFAKKKEKAERKLGRDFIKNEISSAFNAEHDPGVRYYNSVAIRVKKGEKSVDAKTIEAVAQGKPENEVRTKEDRSKPCQMCCMSTQKQKRLLRRKPAVVVGTPGRVYALLGLGEEVDKCQWLREGLKCLRHLVLDEADRLVESGHFKELDKILELVYSSVARPQQLQTFVFSATLTLDPRAQRGEEAGKVDALMSRLRFREKRAVFTVDLSKEPQSSKEEKEELPRRAKLPETLRFKELMCSGDKEKEPLLAVWLLRRFRWGLPVRAQAGGYAARVSAELQQNVEPEGGRVILFVNAISYVQRLSSVLALLLESPSASKVLSKVRMQGGKQSAPPGRTVDVLDLHSKMRQKDRLKRIERFRKLKDAVLVCTDIAARGLDVPDVSAVLHFQAPRGSEVFVHRSGRTARAGREGQSIAFVAPGDVEHWRRVYQAVGIAKEDTEAVEVFAEEISAAKEAARLAAELEKKVHQTSKQSSEQNWLKRAAREAELMLDEDQEEDLRAAAPRKALWGLFQQLQARLRQPPRRSGAARLTKRERLAIARRGR